MNDGIVLYVKASVLQYRIVRNEDAVFEFGGCRFIGSVGNACIDDDIVEDPVASQSVIFNSTLRWTLLTLANGWVAFD